MTQPLRLFRCLPCAILLLALILSAAAWGAHSVTHGLDQVASAGTPTGHKAAPDPDKQDGGHDHLQGFSFPVAALFDGSTLAPPPLPAAAPPIARVATLALRPYDPPLPDPPRAA